MNPLVEDISETCLSSAKSICYFFCLPLSSQPRLREHPCCCALRRLSLGRLLNGKQKNSIYSPRTLGRGQAYISEMSSTSGCKGAKYFQQFGPSFFGMSSASGNMGATDFQEFGPRFLACHVPNVACQGAPISIQSISSVSCRVRILRVSISMPCRGHPVGACYLA